MKIIGKRVLVEKLPDEKQDGFKGAIVGVQDSFLYKGKVVQLGDSIFNVCVGDTILFAKYSPDTHEFEHDDTLYKSVSLDDIIVIL
jgi:co-chaperonin GroES (HSP10)